LQCYLDNNNKLKEALSLDIQICRKSANPHTYDKLPLLHSYFGNCYVPLTGGFEAPEVSSVIVTRVKEQRFKSINEQKQILIQSSIMN
jgi:hypothetical protein